MLRKTTQTSERQTKGEKQHLALQVLVVRVCVYVCVYVQPLIVNNNNNTLSRRTHTYYVT